MTGERAGINRGAASGGRGVEGETGGAGGGALESEGGAGATGRRKGVCRVRRLLPSSHTLCTVDMDVVLKTVLSKLGGVMIHPVTHLKTH